MRVSAFEFDGITKWYNLPEHLSLAYNNNYLTFNYIGITMNQPKKVKYVYKLIGNDKNWSAITNRTEATYGNLPHGNYTFLVKAMNSDGYWSPEYKYEFVIRPPWWKTWWAYTFYIVFSLTSLWLFYKWRIAALEKEKRILEEKVALRTQQLEEKTVLAEANEQEALHQKELVEERQKEILDSIRYAARIQRSLITSEKYIAKQLNKFKK